MDGQHRSSLLKAMIESVRQRVASTSLFLDAPKVRNRSVVAVRSVVILATLTRLYASCPD